jgi:minor extracellular serine protease Vpr
MFKTSLFLLFLSAATPVFAQQGFLILANPDLNTESLQRQGFTIGSQIGNVLSLRGPLQGLDILKQNPSIQRVEMAALIAPQLERVRADTRADSVHAGLGLPKEFTGKNVIIGITDWGFDYTHPTFYDTALSRYRIVAAWDQYKTSGPPPQNVNYGTVYNTEQSLKAAESDTANIYKVHYHGTHVAGIAAGGGAGTNAIGLAPEADLVFLTFLIDAAAVLDGIVWMKSIADNEAKRLVINMSWGLYQLGALDGTSLLSNALDSLSAQGVVFVTSAGNNGDVNFHIEHHFQQDSIVSRVNFYPYSANENMYGQRLLMWGEPGKHFKAYVRILAPGNTVLASTPLIYTADSSFNQQGTLLLGTDTIQYQLEVSSLNPGNGRPNMSIIVNNPFTQYATDLVILADSGSVHAWNITELTTNVGNWGMPFTAPAPFYTAGNNQYGIGEPACTPSVISVAAYTSEFLVNGNTVGGNLANFSSAGPLINGIRKPDIAAPGVNVLSAINAYTNAPFTLAQSVNFQGKSYPFARLSGTSMSAPVVSGIVALMLEANPSLSPQEIKEILIRTARTDSKTGTLPPDGHLRWGHGKVHAWKAVQEALNALSIQNNHKENALILFPNPANHTIHLQLPIGNHQAIITIYDMQGKTIMHTEVNTAEPLSISQIPSGLYTVTALSQSKTFKGKVWVCNPEQ